MMSQIGNRDHLAVAVLLLVGELLLVSSSLADDAKSGDWSVDIRTGKLSDRDLQEVLSQFEAAAKKSPAARQAELEKCYRQSRVAFPDALEIDVIYACQLVAAHRNVQAKSHLDRRIKEGLGEYWPARRLAIYLHATTDSVPIVAKKLAAFSSDLLAKEERPEVLNLNVAWLGQALEGMRRSAPTDDAVKQVIEACEQTLQAHAAALQKGQAAAADVVLKMEPAKKTAAAKFDDEKENVQKEIDRTQESIDKKEVELKKAQEVIQAATTVFEKATKPLHQTMTSLTPQIQLAEGNLVRAQQSYNKASTDKDQDRKDLEIAGKDLKNARNGLGLLQSQFSAAQQKYQELCKEFNQKYAAELLITGNSPKNLRIKGATQMRNAKARDRLQNKQHTTLAFRAVDFLRPDVALILSDLANSIAP